MHSGDIEGGKIYICRVSSGTEGYHFNVQNIKASPGITFTVGERFDGPFVIDALEISGRGEIHYTLHNNDHVWKHDAIQYKCTAENYVDSRSSQSGSRSFVASGEESPGSTGQGAR